MWILPSRARPQSVARFFAAYRATGGGTEGLVLLDTDEPHLKAYTAMEYPSGWSFEVRDRKPVGHAINETFNRYPDKAWYGLAADDMLPTTQRWDTKLVEAAGRDCMAYGADGINDERQFCHGVIGGDLVRELGWIILPGLARLYGDNVLTDIGKKRGCLRYLPDVRVEHLHFSNGKAPYDEVYVKPEAAADKAIYEKWVAHA